MKCPYKVGSMKHVEQSNHNIINEEVGISDGTSVIISETYQYCDCIKEDCAVWYDGKCNYNK